MTEVETQSLVETEIETDCNYDKTETEVET